MIASLALLLIGFCLGVLVQDGYDLMFHVERWLRRLPWLR